MRSAVGDALPPICARAPLTPGSDSAPTSRMTSRGAVAAVVAVGNDVTAFGYPSTVENNEMRAERIIVADKTYEMR